MVNPYKSLPARAFWRKAVADVHYMDVCELWEPMDLVKTDRVATAGSCFAQHIGNNLAAHGANFMDMEPPPLVFEDTAEARLWGYGVYSCRYGNIYTSRQLLQLFQEAFTSRVPEERIWTKYNRFYDALRPGVDPVGQDSPETILELREHHLDAVRRMFLDLDVFVFTMGLTEGWEHVDGTMYPIAPGTIAGDYVEGTYRFRNLSFSEVKADMKAFWEQLRHVNESARMLLTVSPVPLTATATEHHVLTATTYSKSVLRAVAGELASGDNSISYFPSYEIISSHPSRAMFYNPDMRTVNDVGVSYVMRHFFSGGLAKEFGVAGSPETEEVDLICDESRLEDAR